VLGSDPQARRQLYGTAGVLGVPRRWWWHWLRSGLLAAGEIVRRLWEKVEAVYVRVSKSPSFWSSGGTLQQRALHSLSSGAHRCGCHA